MPVLAIIGGKPEPKKTMAPMKRMGGIGGSYSKMGSESEGMDSSSGESDMKAEAAKAALGAIKSNDPQQFAEAISMLVESCMNEGSDTEESE